MDSRSPVVRQRERKAYKIECMHDPCNWTSPIIHAFNHSEAAEIASGIHDTNSDHHLKWRSDRKNYFVTCECGAEMIFKANCKKKEVQEIAKAIHDPGRDHELKIKSVRELK